MRLRINYLRRLQRARPAFIFAVATFRARKALCHRLGQRPRATGNRHQL